MDAMYALPVNLNKEIFYPYALLAITLPYILAWLVQDILITSILLRLHARTSNVDPTTPAPAPAQAAVKNSTS